MSTSPRLVNAPTYSPGWTPAILATCSASPELSTSAPRPFTGGCATTASWRGSTPSWNATWNTSGDRPYCDVVTLRWPEALNILKSWPKSGVLSAVTHTRATEGMSRSLWASLALVTWSRSHASLSAQPLRLVAATSNTEVVTPLVSSPWRPGIFLGNSATREKRLFSLALVTCGQGWSGRAGQGRGGAWGRRGAPLGPPPDQPYPHSFIGPVFSPVGRLGSHRPKKFESRIGTWRVS